MAPDDKEPRGKKTLSNQLPTSLGLRKDPDSGPGAKRKEINDHPQYGSKKTGTHGERCRTLSTIRKCTKMTVQVREGVKKKRVKTKRVNQGKRIYS